MSYIDIKKIDFENSNEVIKEISSKFTSKLYNKKPIYNFNNNNNNNIYKKTIKFVDCKFNELNNTIFEYNLFFSKCTFTKKFNISNCIFLKSVTFDDCDFEEDFNIDTCQFNPNFQEIDLKFHNLNLNTIDIKKCRFNYSSIIITESKINNLKLNSEENIFYNSKLHIYNSKIYSSFDISNISFNNSKIHNNNIYFKNVHFNGDFTRFSYMSSSDKLKFLIESCYFYSNTLQFYNADLSKTDIIFKNSILKSEKTNFSGSVFNSVEFLQSTLDNYYLLNFKKCHRLLLHKNTIIKGVVNFYKDSDEENYYYDNDNENIDFISIYKLNNLGNLLIKFEQIFPAIKRFSESEEELIEYYPDIIDENYLYSWKKDQFHTLKTNYEELGEYDDEDSSYVEFKKNEAKTNNRFFSNFIQKIGDYGTNPKKAFRFIFYIIILFFGLFLSFSFVSKYIFDIGNINISYEQAYKKEPKINYTLVLNLNSQKYTLTFNLPYHQSNSREVKYFYNIKNGYFDINYERKVIYIKTQEKANYKLFIDAENNNSLFYDVLRTLYYSSINLLTVGDATYTAIGLFKFLVVFENFIGIFLVFYLTLAFSRKLLR